MSTLIKRPDGKALLVINPDDGDMALVLTAGETVETFGPAFEPGQMPDELWLLDGLSIILGDAELFPDLVALVTEAHATRDGEPEAADDSASDETSGDCESPRILH